MTYLGVVLDFVVNNTKRLEKIDIYNYTWNENSFIIFIDLMLIYQTLHFNEVKPFLGSRSPESLY